MNKTKGENGRIVLNEISADHKRALALFKLFTNGGVFDRQTVGEDGPRHVRNISFSCVAYRLEDVYAAVSWTVDVMFKGTDQEVYLRSVREAYAAGASAYTKYNRYNSSEPGVMVVEFNRQDDGGLVVTVSTHVDAGFELVMYVDRDGGSIYGRTWPEIINLENEE